MKQWKLATLEKKSVVEMITYTKSGVDGYLQYESQYRWGSVLIESEERPDIDLDNEHGIEVYYDIPHDVQPDDLSDGSEDWNSSELSKEDQAWFEDIMMQSEESGDSICELIENEGWDSNDHEVHFSGPLELTEVN